MNNRILVIALLPLSMIGGWKLHGWVDDNSIRLSDANRLSIDQLQMLSSLVTARVEVAEMMTSEMDGFAGSERIAILIKGDCLVGTDLSQARFEQIKPLAHRACLALAAPTLTSVRVDMRQSRICILDESGLWAITPDFNRSMLFEMNRAYADAQQAVSAAGKRPEALRRAKIQAEGALSSFFGALGWDVTIQWADRG